MVNLANNNPDQLNSIIEELKREIESLRESKQNELRFRTLLCSVTDAIYTVNISSGKPKEMIHIYTNPKLIGYTSEEFEKDPTLWESIIYEMDHTSVEKMIDNLISKNRSTPINHRIFHRDGSIHWVKHSLVPFHNDRGQLVSYNGMLKDITFSIQDNTMNTTRLYMMQYADTHSLDDFLEEVLNEAEKLTHSKFSVFSFFDEKQDMLTIQNWSTTTKEQLNSKNIRELQYDISKGGSWTECIRTKKPVIHNNYKSVNNRNGLSEGYPELEHELVLPIIRGGKIKAIISVGDKKKNYSSSDILLLSEIADFTWEIAERKRAEDKMILSDQRLRLHMEQSPLGFLEWDDKFCAIQWNAAAEKIFGFTHEEAIGKHAKQLILPPEVHELVDDLYVTLMAQAGGHYSVNENITKDGRIIICEWFNTTLIDKNGKAIGVASVFRDITEQKQMEKELAGYREHLEDQVNERTLELEMAKNKAQQYLDIAGVILVAISKDKKVSLINQKGSEILGYKAEEIIGRDWFKNFIPSSDRPNVIKGFNMMMEGKLEPFERFENYIITKNGTERLVSWQNVILKDQKGEIIGSLSSGEDITEQKKAEEKIIRLNRELTKRASALEEANKELESFAYSISHDLRAPLRHIDGYIGLLRSRITDILDEKSRHFLLEISNSAELMSNLIDDLLSFSRTSRQPMTLNQVNINKIVKNVIEMFDPNEQDRVIEWDIKQIPLVTGDPALLQIVMTNLLSNAIKFTKNRQKAKIEIDWKESDVNEIIIMVKDNGVGFDSKYSEKLFSVFQRLHDVNEYEGTGVGLAIAQRIIHRHGGKIWAESEIDKGTIFYYSLQKFLNGG